MSIEDINKLLQQDMSSSPLASTAPETLEEFATFLYSEYENHFNPEFTPVTDPYFGTSSNFKDLNQLDILLKGASPQLNYEITINYPEVTPTKTLGELATVLNSKEGFNQEFIDWYNAIWQAHASILPSIALTSESNIEDILHDMEQSGLITVQAETLPPLTAQNSLNEHFTTFLQQLTEADISTFGYALNDNANTTVANFFNEYLAYLDGSTVEDGGTIALPTGYPKDIPFVFKVLGTGEEFQDSTGSTLKIETLSNKVTATIAPITDLYQEFVNTYGAIIEQETNWFLDASGTALPPLTADRREFLVNNGFRFVILRALENKDTLDVEENLLGEFSQLAYPLAIAQMVDDPEDPFFQDYVSGGDFLNKLEELYDGLLPDQPGGFVQHFTQFITAYVGQKEVILERSAMISAYFKEVVETASDRTIYFKDPLAESGFDQVALLLQIYDLIISMLGDMHGLLANQTAKQGFLGNYQKAYTELLQTATTIAPTEGEKQIYNLPGASGPIEFAELKPNLITDGVPYQDAIGGTNDTSIQRRADVNQLIAQWSENIRSFRSEVSDLSKQQTTTVSQSQESVSQQLNIGGAIIQQFSSLLSSIWR